MVELVDALERLLTAYGPRGWWPLPSLAGTPGRDGTGYALGPSLPVGSGGGANERSLRFEIAVGAVLAQNTAWAGAERAVATLVARSSAAGLPLSPQLLRSLAGGELEDMLRPAGTFRIKAGYLRSLASAWSELDEGVPTRDGLLALPGIGFETADCVLLYAYGVPAFVADAYARRLLSRLGYALDSSSYEGARHYAEERLPHEAPFLAEAHALIVEHCKLRCRSRPLCDGCPLATVCDHCR
ncbi:MAG TPA: DNA repair protein [Spirochaetales bacterium]|nr:DNA repair protein [Spirochaetales bacterium]HPG87264.1 DNA repair protein [Spirochaetales bacterium]